LPCMHTLSFAVGMIPFRDLILQVQGLVIQLDQFASTREM